MLSKKRFDQPDFKTYSQMQELEACNQCYFVINAIKKRFDQPDFKTYSQMQELLLKAVRGEQCDDDLVSVVTVFAGDIDPYCLKTLLSYILLSFRNSSRTGSQR